MYCCVTERGRRHAALDGLQGHAVWRPEAVNMCREEPRPLILHGAGPGKKHLLGDIIPALMDFWARAP